MKYFHNSICWKCQKGNTKKEKSIYKKKTTTPNIQLTTLQPTTPILTHSSLFLSLSTKHTLSLSLSKISLSLSLPSLAYDYRSGTTNHLRFGFEV